MIFILKRLLDGIAVAAADRKFRLLNSLFSPTADGAARHG
jgi:hypothetical protein